MLRPFNRLLSASSAVSELSRQRALGAGDLDPSQFSLNSQAIFSMLTPNAVHCPDR
jgi:hypothetical protein